jgi:hypothetical protein
VLFLVVRPISSVKLIMFAIISSFSHTNQWAVNQGFCFSL